MRIKLFNLFNQVSLNDVAWSTKQREPALAKIGLVGDHEEEEDEQEADAPGRAAGAVEGVLLRQREEEEGGVEGGEQMHGEEEEQRREHEEELDLIEEALEDGLVVDVPGDSEEGEEDDEEAAEVDRRRGVAVAVWHHWN